MRRKTKIKKKLSVPNWIYTSLGYFFISILIIFHLLNYFLKLYEIYNILPNYSAKIWQETLILVGAPLILSLSFLLSFKWRKLCGALLLFGSALISAGIAFQSGYFLKMYLLKMAIIGMPQIFCSFFFLKSQK